MRPWKGARWRRSHAPLPECRCPFRAHHLKTRSQGKPWAKLSWPFGPPEPRSTPRKPSSWSCRASQLSEMSKLQSKAGRLTYAGTLLTRAGSSTALSGAGTNWICWNGLLSCQGWVRGSWWISVHRAVRCQRFRIFSIERAWFQTRAERRRRFMSCRRRMGNGSA